MAADPLSAPGRQQSAGVRRTLIETRFGQMHTRISGHYMALERPPLVLLHPTPLSSAMYLPLLERFGQGRLVVAPDRLGAGYSDMPSEPLSTADYAMAALDVVDTLDIEQFYVLGTHTGAVEAIELAWSNTDRVEKVVLVSIPAYTPEERMQRELDTADAPRPTEDGSHLAWHWQRRFLDQPAPPYDLARFHWRLLQELLAGPRFWLPDQAAYAYPTAERLAELVQPVMVLAPHDELWPQTERVWRGGGLPVGARYVDLPHLGANSADTAPDEIARLVESFLDGVERD
jgi:pimeloyl-ACP methyl ester carboxylesterase